MTPATPIMDRLFEGPRANEEKRIECEVTETEDFYLIRVPKRIRVGDLTERKGHGVPKVVYAPLGIRPLMVEFYHDDTAGTRTSRLVSNSKVDLGFRIR